MKLQLLHEAAPAKKPLVLTAENVLEWGKLAGKLELHHSGADGAELEVNALRSFYLNLAEHSTTIPVRFNAVGGSFACNDTKPKLTSLVNSPRTVGLNFYCDHNKLTSLEGAPERVKGIFSCLANPLTTLKGLPKVIGELHVNEDCPLVELGGSRIDKVVLYGKDSPSNNAELERLLNAFVAENLLPSNAGKLRLQQLLIEAGFDKQAEA